MASTGLANIGDDNVVPKSRLADAASARGILGDLITADQQASYDRSRIQRVIDGCAPFSVTELKKNGRGWMPNKNWGGARAKITDAMLPYYDLVSSPETVAVVRVHTGGDPAQRSEWGSTISEGFHKLLMGEFNDPDDEDEFSFLYEMELSQSQMVKFGIGPVFRRDKRDWRFHALKRRNIQVPKDSAARLAAMEIVFIRDQMRVHELFQYIENREAAARIGWNYKAVMEAIKSASSREQNADLALDYEFFQERFKNNAYDWSYTQSKIVAVAHAFVREFDRRISHHIFTEKGDEDYLFSEIGCYSNMQQPVWVGFADIGTGDFESVRGLGMDAASYGETQDRMNNMLILNALTGSSVMLQAENAESVDKLPNIEVGPFRVLPPGVTFQQVNMGGAIQAALAVQNQFAMQEAQITGSYRTQALTPMQQARTATEVEAEVGEKAKLSNSRVEHYLMQLDYNHAETYRRAMICMVRDPGGKAALKFRQWCEDRDVPPEAMKFENVTVKAARTIGNGSSADRAMRLRRIGTVVNEMPEPKRAQYVRDLIAQEGGSRELADRYGPDQKPTGATFEAKMARVENIEIKNGADAEEFFSLDDNHASHFPIHLEFAGRMIQGAQEDPQMAAEVLDELGPHMAAHLEALARDPTRESMVNEFKQQLADVMKLADRIKGMADQMQEMQEPQENNPEMIAMMRDQYRKDQIAMRDEARKDRKASQGLAIKDVQAAQKMRITREKQMLEAQAVPTE